MPNIAVIAGDGIGKEVLDEGIKVLQHVAPDLRFDHLPYGADHYLATGETITPEHMQALRDYDAIYLGALGDPRVKSNVHAKEILLGMRFQLDLYINLRPCKLLDPRYCPLKDKGPQDLSFTVFRENTEGLYTGVGGQFKRNTPDEVAIEAELNTRKGVERIVRAAFGYARKHGLKSLCMSDKSNAMRHGHDLWQRVFREVGAEYDEIEQFHLYVDVLTMEMVRAPERFDVIVTNNLFGDIVTDLGAQLQGGIGLAAFFWTYEPPVSEVWPPQSVTTCPSSVALSKELKKRGWKFVGPTTCFAFMEAMGLINNHVEGCALREAAVEARSVFQPPE